MAAEEYTAATEDISELISRRQNYEQQQQHQRKDSLAGGKARTFAKPMKPLFEGKSVAEVLRRNSDSTTNSEKLAELDEDEISLNCVQDMPVVQSISESPGILSMVANVTRLRPKKSVEEKPRIGELPNKKRLQAQVEKQPIEMTDWQQNSGTFMFNHISKSDTKATPQTRRKQVLQGLRSPGTPSSGRPSSSKNHGTPTSAPNNSSNSRRQSWNLFRGNNLRDLIKPDAVKPQTLDDDDSFFAMMDDSEPSVSISSIPEIGKDRPASMSSLPSYESPEQSTAKERGGFEGLQKARERRAQRGSMRRQGSNKSPTRGTSSRSEKSEASDSNNSESLDSPEQAAVQSSLEDNVDWLPIVRPTALSSPTARNYVVEPSDHSRSSIAAALRPLNKETLMAQEMARKQQEAVAAALLQTLHSVESQDLQSVMELDSDDLEIDRNKEEWHAVSEDGAKAHAKQINMEEDNGESSDEEAVLRPLSKEAQRLQSASRKRKEQVRTAISETADVEESLEKPSKIVAGADKKDIEKKEWHDITGDSARLHSKNVTTDRDYGNKNDPKSRGKGKKKQNIPTLSNRLPHMEAAAERSSMDDSNVSMPSLANLTVRTEEGSFTSDTFSQQFVVKTSGGTRTATLVNDSHYSRKDEDPIMLLQRRSLASVNASKALEEPPPIEEVISPNKDHAWERVDPKRQPPLDSRKGDTYHQRERQKSNPNLGATLERKPKNPIDISNHSGDSSMGESYLMDDDIPSIYTGSIATALNPLLSVREAPDREPESIGKNMPQQGGMQNMDAKSKPVQNSSKEKKDRSKKSSSSRSGDANFGWHRVSIDQPSLELEGAYKNKEGKGSRGKNRNVRGGTRGGDRKERKAKGTRTLELPKKDKNWHSLVPQNTVEDKEMYPQEEVKAKDETSPKKITSGELSSDDDSVTRYAPTDKDLQQAPGGWKGLELARGANAHLYKEKSDTNKSAKSPNGDGRRLKSEERSTRDDKQEISKGREKSPKRRDENNNSEKGKTGSDRKGGNGSNKRDEQAKPRGNVTDKRTNGDKRDGRSPSRQKYVTDTDDAKGASRASKGEKENKSSAPTNQHEDLSHDSPQAVLGDEGRSSLHDIYKETPAEQTSEVASQSQDPESSEANVLDPFALRPPDQGPFVHRPPEAGPFAARPLAEPFSNRPLGEGRFSSDDLGMSNHSTGSLDRNSPPHTDAPDSPDDLTTQSVDRHLVRESSHRRLLRKQVADRRETLSSMLQATTKHNINTEDELLDLKRKLALSQALVQQLEVENAAIQRQAILDIARAQLSLLEQRNNREKELEKQIHNIMAERNASVRECHDLRILIMGSCSVCRRRFEDREYVMDNSIRKTILSKQNRRKSSAFEWFTDNLSSETKNLKDAETCNNEGSRHREVENGTPKLHGLDVETISLATTILDTNSVQTGNLPNFTEAPLHWLSDKLFTRSSEDVNKQISDDLPMIEEVITYQRVPNQQQKTLSKSGESHREGHQSPDSGTRGTATLLRNGAETKNDQHTAESPMHSIEVESDPLNNSYTKEAENNGTGQGELVVAHEVGQDVQDPWTIEPKNVEEDNETASRASAGSEKWAAGSKEPQDASTKKKNRFLGGLLGERVQDEFSSLSLQGTQHPDTKSIKPNGPKQFSFFRSLMGERLDEDAAFARIESSLDAIQQPSEGKDYLRQNRKFGDRLQSEQVLDDMAIFNSLLSISQKPSPDTGRGTQADASFIHKKKGLFGLKDEKFDDAIHDHQILTNVQVETQKKPAGATIRKGIFKLKDEKVDDDNFDNQVIFSSKEGSDESTRNLSVKKKGLLGLRDEKFDHEEHDNQLLNLLKESGETTQADLDIIPLSAEKDGDPKRYMPKIPNRSRDGLWGERVEDDMRFLDRTSPSQSGQPSLSPSSGLSSPFASHEASPRKRATTNRGRRGSAAVGSYLGRFSSAGVQSSSGDRPSGFDQQMLGPVPLLDDDKGEEWPEKNGDIISASPKKSNKRASMAVPMPLDVDILGDRPWRKDTGKRPITLPPINSLDESAHASEHASKLLEKSASLDDIDHVTSLMVQENADCELVVLLCCLA